MNILLSSTRQWNCGDEFIAIGVKNILKNLKPFKNANFFIYNRAPDLHFLRHEKNISEVYGPPSKINQKESGVSSVYSNTLDQKFSNAFYRSTWTANPAVIELYLNSSILMPKTDLSIFSGNNSVLKLVYYNPDYMHSSKPTPEPQSLPSIFDIY